MDEKDGGLAFGGMVTEDNGIAGNVHSWKKGMSQRDWFAGQALAGIMANSREDYQTELSITVEHSYKIADAMIAEREKGGGV